MGSGHHTLRSELHLRLVVMLDSCRQALRVATEMDDQPLVGLLFEQQTKLTAMVEAVRP